MLLSCSRDLMSAAILLLGLFLVAAHARPPAPAACSAFPPSSFSCLIVVVRIRNMLRSVGVIPSWNSDWRCILHFLSSQGLKKRPKLLRESGSLLLPTFRRFYPSFIIRHLISVGGLGLLLWLIGQWSFAFEISIPIFSTFDFKSCEVGWSL